MERRFVLLLPGICLAVLYSVAVDRALANISANDNRRPAGRMDSGVLTLHLELREGLWHPEVENGRAISTYSFAEEISGKNLKRDSWTV